MTGNRIQTLRKNEMSFISKIRIYMMNKESLLKGCLLGILGFAAQWVTAQTFDNETVTAIWGMSGGANEPSQAVVSNEHAFSTTAFVLGK